MEEPTGYVRPQQKGARKTQRGGRETTKALEVGRHPPFSPGLPK